MSNDAFNSILNLNRRKLDHEERCNKLILALLEDTLSLSTAKARKLLLLVSAISFLFTIGDFFPSKIDALGINIPIEDRIIIIRIMLILLIYFLLSFNFYSYGDYTSWENKRSQLRNWIEELNAIKTKIKGYQHKNALAEKDPLSSAKEYKEFADDVKEVAKEKLKKPREIVFSKYPKESYFLTLRIFWEFVLPDIVAIFALILLIIK